jgi:sulfonate transport system substrate-binding protein
MSITKRSFIVGATAVSAFTVLTGKLRAEPVKSIRLDFATYNPVSLILKNNGFLEKELASDGISVEWVPSAGSNVALDLLKNDKADFGSAAGAAALIGRANGNPLKSVFVFSRPEWTALVVGASSPLTSLTDIKGKKVAATPGTDPHIFLLRALESVGMTDKDIVLKPLPHAEGRAALEKGEVDAWAGLDPIMAQSELVAKSRLLFRDPVLNTYGILNVREAFAAANPELVKRVLKVYDQARLYAAENPDELRAALAAAAKIDDAVASRQLERTDLRNSIIGTAQQRIITAAGEVLKQSGIIPASVDIDKVVASMIDRSFAPAKA